MLHLRASEVCVVEKEKGYGNRVGITGDNCTSILATLVAIDLSQLRAFRGLCSTYLSEMTIGRCLFFGGDREASALISPVFFEYVGNALDEITDSEVETPFGGPKTNNGP